MMLRNKSKTCPGCKKKIKGGNKQLVVHMQRNKTCRNHIKYCIGCKKACANLTHLENHQTQQQMKFDNSFCIQGLEKLEKAQVLQINCDTFLYL